MKNMKDYNLIEEENKILVFLDIEDFPDKLGKLNYKQLTNIIYELSEGYCITDKKNKPLIVKDDLNSCMEFLNEEYSKMFEEFKMIELSVNET